jgi:hypothetical protein
VAALAAGVDHGTAYQHRKRDPGFAERWAAALAAAAAGAAAAFCAGGTAARRDRTAGLSGWGGEALVARLSKRHGVQMVREGEGRYSAERGAAFIAALRATGCVKRAAAAAGISTTSFYKRRGRYPGFAAEWAAAEQDAKARLHGFVLAAGIAAFDPDGPGDAETPKVTVSEAIAILRLKGGAAPAPARTAAAGAGGAEEPPIEQVRDDVLRQVAAIRRKAEREGGA